MEPIINTGNDVITIVSEPGALVFATRKEWTRLPESRLDTLAQLKTECVFMSVYSVFFLFRYMYPLDGVDEYQLVKIQPDEELKPEFYAMNLTRAEAEQLQRCRYSFWG